MNLLLKGTAVSWYLISHQLNLDSFVPISCTYRGATISRLSGAKTIFSLNIFGHYDARFGYHLQHLHLGKSNMFTPIIFFLGFTSRECLYLNTVFLLIVSLHRFKVLAIFLYYVDKFYFLYWPDELFLRILNKGSQPLCWLVCWLNTCRFWGNVDILYRHNILIFWINLVQSKQILVHLLVSDVVSLEINKVIRHLSEHDFFNLISLWRMESRSCLLNFLSLSSHFLISAWDKNGVW